MQANDTKPLASGDQLTMSTSTPSPRDPSPDGKSSLPGRKAPVIPQSWVQPLNMDCVPHIGTGVSYATMERANLT